MRWQCLPSYELIVYRMWLYNGLINNRLVSLTYIRTSEPWGISGFIQWKQNIAINKSHIYRNELPSGYSILMSLLILVLFLCSSVDCRCRHCWLASLPIAQTHYRLGRPRWDDLVVNKMVAITSTCTRKFISLHLTTTGSLSSLFLYIFVVHATSLTELKICLL